MEWFSKNRWWLGGVALFCTGVVVRFLAVDQTPHPTGWDGYYYAMQIRSWIIHGRLQSADASLIYPYFIFIAMILGDTILAFKAGVALLSGILVLSTYWYLWRRGVYFGFVFLAGAYVCFSPLLTYFILQFPKNILGLIFLILFVDALLTSPETARSRLRYLVLALLAILTHRMTAGFVLVLMLVVVIKRLSWKWVVAFVVVVLLLSLLPGILHVSDLERFKDQFIPVPQWAPWSFYQIFGHSSWWMNIDLLLISASAVFLLSITAWRWRELKWLSLPWLIVLMVCLFPFFPVVAGSAGHRFFLITPLALVMLAAHLKRPILAGAGTQLPAIAAVLLLAMSFLSYQSYIPKLVDPPNKRYASVVGRLNALYHVQEYPLVIVHKGLAEMIKFESAFDVLNWLPPESIDPNKVLRVSGAVKYQAFRKYLDPEERKRIQSLSAGYLALPEPMWQKFVSNVRAADDKLVLRDIFGGMNPMDPRPGYLNKGK